MEYIIVIKNFLRRIFHNETMYYVVVPIVIVLLQWLKNKCDLKKKNKKLGYWKIKYRALTTFLDIIMKNYKIMLVCLVIAWLIKVIFNFMGMPKLVFYILEIIYLGINGLATVLVWRSARAKVELLKNGKKKMIFVFILWLIYGFALVADVHNTNPAVMQSVFIISLSVWAIILFKCCDRAVILDNSYADIYIKGSECAQFVEAGSIMKHGDWIIVNRYINGLNEEIRIKEGDIVRIDYYGDPRIIVDKKIF